MRTLVYKRTHNGDPDSRGRFGARDCMGRIRSLDFEAVIGVGGQGSEAKRNDIDGRVNWIGIGAHKAWVEGMDDPIVTFDHFLDLGTTGPDLWLEAPELAKRLYVNKARIVLGFSRQERAEVDRLLALAATAPSSVARTKTARLGKRRCRPCRPSGC